MEEIKPLVTEKYEFQPGDEWLFLAQFGFFGLSGLNCKEQNQLRTFKGSFKENLQGVIFNLSP